MVRKTETVTVDQQIANEVERQVSEQLNPSALSAPGGIRIGTQYDETDEDFTLTNVLAELGSSADDAKVNVHLMEPGKQSAFVDSFAPSDFSLEMLKQTYGPGTYKIQIRANGRIIPGGRVVRIAKSINTFSGAVPPPQFAPDKLIETMNIGFERLGSMFAQAIQSLASNQPKPKSTMETLEELRLMREVMGGNVAPPPPQDPYAILALASELAGKMSPQPNDENSLLMEGIKQFGPLLTNLAGGQQGLQGQLAQGLNNQPRVLPPPPPQPRPISSQTMPANSSAPIIQPDEANMNMMINMYLKTLVANAQADNDPMTYAQATMDFMGDDEAVKLANNPDWFKLLCERVPEAAPFEVWFNELREGIIYLTKPDETGTSADIQNNDGAANAADPVPAGP